MPLHPEIAKILATLPAPPPGPLNPAAMRAAEEAQVAPVEERLPLAAVEDMTAQTPAGEVPGADLHAGRRRLVRAALYFHGGAYFLGSLDTHDHVARSLAKETGMKVVSVGYRRAPEAAYPAGLQDCYGVVRWAVGSGATWSGTARRSRSPATVPAAAWSLPSRRWPTTTGSTASPTR